MEDKTFVCGIGAQKAGTTFLADYFASHHQFMMSDLKELHYFDSKFLPKLSGNFESRFKNKINEIVVKLLNGKDINSKLLIALIKRIEASNENDYKSYFDYYIKKQHIAFGEITPAYSMLNKEHFQKIISIYPKHKFIFLLRNPADRFWSQINFEIQSNKTNLNPTKLIEKCLERNDYILRSNYKRTIEELQAVVRKENIYIEFYENIFSTNKEKNIISEISKFIGIEYNENIVDQNKKINVTKYKEEMDATSRRKIVKKLESTYRFIFDNYVDIPKSYLDDISKYLNNFKG